MLSKDFSGEYIVKNTGNPVQYVYFTGFRSSKVRPRSGSGGDWGTQPKISTLGKTSVRVSA
jgi:hypothetical protein